MITLLMQASPHPHQMFSLLVSIIHSSKAVLSNLIFADDVVITTDWNSNDLSDIIQILNEFYKASGLKINISKSNIGVGVSMEDLDVMASSTGYTTAIHGEDADIVNNTYSSQGIWANIVISSNVLHEKGYGFGNLGGGRETRGGGDGLEGPGGQLSIVDT
ncbi:hypothetical protein Tco_0854450 [Tanacetum coccineum]